ncbi:hypothetical protein RSOL_064770 [Rhizoctonia solani AG-3 Rhs1AP]|uniref:Uncharacterized protein n=1 Tax=Rhizoctonia solani AG-3 Rhs1AP TaxID=1086054 RepID=X8IYB3_9AGAM|nr:hypothetical protein RSOL_064770 [Rhizoctonia solani AG-3 Rhs1AP]
MAPVCSGRSHAQEDVHDHPRTAPRAGFAL